jgi:hypothetical protein
MDSAATAPVVKPEKSSSKAAWVLLYYPHDTLMILMLAHVLLVHSKQFVVQLSYQSDSVGCRNLHGAAKTRESMAILTCHRSKNNQSRSFHLLYVLYLSILLTGPGIRLGSFMRLRENNSTQATGFQKKRENYHQERLRWRLWKWKWLGLDRALAYYEGRRVEPFNPFTPHRRPSKSNQIDIRPL